MEHIAHVQLHLLISYGQLLERAAGAPILKDREDREVKGDGGASPMLSLKYSDVIDQCVKCEQMRLSPGCGWQEVQQIAKSHALLSSRWRGPQPSSWLLATNDIVLGQQFQEIFISYGIREYWLPCIARKVSQWRVANEMV